jgi:formate dehydrogenase subunit gamma
MSRSDPGALPRFTRGQRWVHRSLVVLAGVCLATAALLYVPELSALIGRRDVVATVHVVAGFLLPVPIVLGLALSAALRADVRRLNRFGPRDWEWLRSADRRSGRIVVGKFNAGQKLNAAFTLGTVLVMLGTGVLMRFTGLAPLEWRTGATFVHDWLALAFAVVVAGHAWMAARDPVARSGMRTGFVPLEWARAEHGAWATQIEAQGGSAQNGTAQNGTAGARPAGRLDG